MCQNVKMKKICFATLPFSIHVTLKIQIIEKVKRTRRTRRKEKTMQLLQQIGDASGICIQRTNHLNTTIKIRTKKCFNRYYTEYTDKSIPPLIKTYLEIYSHHILLSFFPTFPSALLIS